MLLAAARVLRLWALGIWVGGGVMIFIVAHYVFTVIQDRTLAGSVMAPILHTGGWLQVELAAVALVTTRFLWPEISWKKPKAKVLLAALVAATTMAVFMALWLEPRLVDLRAQFGGPNDIGARESFKQFHGLSMGLALLETICAAVALACVE